MYDGRAMRASDTSKDRDAESTYEGAVASYLAARQTRVTPEERRAHAARWRELAAKRAAERAADEARLAELRAGTNNEA